MSAILLVIGILTTGAGVIAIGFGVRNLELSLGDTLITSGTTALSAGLILIGIAAAVGQLVRIAEAARARPIPRPARPPELKPAVEGPAREPRQFRPPEPRPAADAALDVSASAIERLRSAIPRPDKAMPEADEVPLSPGPAQQPTPSDAFDAAARSTSAAVETKGPRLDFLFRPKSARSAPAEPESFDALWPKRQREPQSQQRAEAPSPAPADRTAAAGASAPHTESRRPADEGASSAGPEGAHSAAILKSGVVDGMAYTLYADGSIEAQLPDGTVRFGSIAELRSHIENNS